MGTAILAAPVLTGILPVKCQDSKHRYGEVLDWLPAGYLK